MPSAVPQRDRKALEVLMASPLSARAAPMAVVQHHTPARGGQTVHHERAENGVAAQKLKFPASLISKFKFKGRFEEISASPS